MSESKETTATIVFKEDNSIEVKLSGMDFVSSQKLYIASKKLNQKFLEFRAKYIESLHQAEAKKQQDVKQAPSPAPLPEASGEKSTAPNKPEDEKSKINDLKQAEKSLKDVETKKPELTNPFKKS